MRQNLASCWRRSETFILINRSNSASCLRSSRSISSSSMRKSGGESPGDEAAASRLSSKDRPSPVETGLFCGKSAAADEICELIKSSCSFNLLFAAGGGGGRRDSAASFQPPSAAAAPPGAIPMTCTTIQSPRNQGRKTTKPQPRQRNHAEIKTAQQIGRERNRLRGEKGLQEEGF